MPALLWVAFWSSMMGAAACWGDARRPVGKDPIRQDVAQELDASSGE